MLFTTANANAHEIMSQSCKKLDKQNKVKYDSGNGNFVHQLPNPSYSPAAENVFLIDHILELIIQGLNPATLLKCRLLSSRWAHLCTKQLQKIVTIMFWQHQRNYPPVIAENLIVLKSHNGGSVKDLIAVIDKSPEFPSASFAFYNICSYYNLNNFFNTCGHLIKKFEYRGILTLQEVRHILLTQAPNLEQLLLNKMYTPIPETSSERYPDVEAHKLLPSTTRFKDGPTTTQKRILKNLQIFKCNDRIPKIFVEQLLESCPNLVEVCLPEEYLHILVKPIDRVHVLKDVTLGFRIPNPHPLDVVLNHHPDRLLLQKISFIGLDRYDESTANLQLQSTEFIRQLLTTSAATCQKLEWIGIVRHFEIPKMQQVTHLNFQISKIDGRPVSIFQKGVTLRDTFPNLKVLAIRSNSYKKPLVPIGFFFGIYNNDVMSPVTNVRHVSLRKFDGAEEYFHDFGQMFPNAILYGYLITMLPVGNRK